MDQIRAEERLRVLAESQEAGLFLAMAEEGRKIFVMGHPEYDRITLDGEYKRDLGKGLEIEVPKNYYENDDPTKKPLLTWRATANNLYLSLIHIQKVRQAFEESLKRLQTDYLDLYLIHWPLPEDGYEDWEKLDLETWRGLEAVSYTHLCTRFPPEPNGYLHIGHAKSILLNSGLAKKYNGTFHLRFDDTNPMKEDMEFVESIKEDVAWLGADWKEHLYFASDYFDVMYECAVKLIKKGKAFVCDLTADEIREYRGTLKEPGKNSPYRDRSVEENLQLFEDVYKRQGINLPLY